MPYRDHDYEGLDEREFPDADPDGDDVETRCPYCGQWIFDEAERCPACGEYITEEEIGHVRPWWVIVAAVVLLIVIVLFWF